MGAQSQKRPERSLTDKQREIIADLHRVADELEETPSAPKYNDHGEFSSGAVQYHFPSWNAAIEIAGLDRNHVYVDDQQALEELREWIDSRDRLPTKDELNKDGPYSISVYRRIADTWSGALRAIGVTDVHEKDIPTKRLEEDYRRVARELAKRPTRDEYREHGFYSANPIEDRWDGWRNASESIDVPELEE